MQNCHCRLLSLVLALLLGTPALGSETVTVYFIPFEIETYVPVTKESIVCDSSEVWTVADKSQIADLTEILRAGSRATFNEKMVRVRIERNGAISYIDAKGTLAAAKSSYQIDRVRFARFGQSLGPEQRKVKSACK